MNTTRFIYPVRNNSQLRIFMLLSISLFLIVGQPVTAGFQPVDGVNAYTYASVGNLVWNDLDWDGVQDAGEPGIANVQVTLHKADKTIVASTQTNASGNFLLRVLPPAAGGDYYLEVDRDSLLDNRKFTLTTTGQDEQSSSDSDFDQDTGKTNCFRSVTGERKCTFSLIPYESLTDQDLGLVEIPECDSVMDVSIVLDGSPRIGPDPTLPNQFGLMTNFARAVTRSFDISSTKAHVGVLQFNSFRETTKQAGSQIEVGLREYIIRDALTRKIDTIIRTEAGGTNIWDGLRLARKQFQDDGRSHVPHVIILVTDGDHQESRFGSPDTMADQLKGEGATIFVVKLKHPNDTLKPPNNTTMKWAEEIASTPLSIFLRKFGEEQAGGQSDLTRILINLLNTVCNLPNAAPIQNYYTTPQPTLIWNPVSWAIEYEVEIADNQRFDTAPIYTERIHRDQHYVIPLSPLADGGLLLARAGEGE